VPEWCFKFVAEHTMVPIFVDRAERPWPSPCWGVKLNLSASSDRSDRTTSTYASACQRNETRSSTDSSGLLALRSRARKIYTRVLNPTFKVPAALVCTEQGGLTARGCKATFSYRVKM